MVVRSNVARPESHLFYEGIGYQWTATSHVYHKQVHGMPARSCRCSEAAASDPEAAGAAYGARLITIATMLRQPRRRQPRQGQA
jgi:hypothetical protein